MNISDIPFEIGSGDVFADIGLPDEAAELTAKSTLILAIKNAIGQRGLTSGMPRGFAARTSPPCRKSSAAAWKA